MFQTCTASVPRPPNPVPNTGDHKHANTCRKCQRAPRLHNHVKDTASAHTSRLFLPPFGRPDEELLPPLPKSKFETSSLLLLGGKPLWDAWHASTLSPPCESVCGLVLRANSDSDMLPVPSRHHVRVGKTVRTCLRPCLRDEATLPECLRGVSKARPASKRSPLLTLAPACAESVLLLSRDASDVGDPSLLHSLLSLGLHAWCDLESDARAALHSAASSLSTACCPCSDACCSFCKRRCRRSRLLLSLLCRPCIEADAVTDPMSMANCPCVSRDSSDPISGAPESDCSGSSPSRAMVSEPLEQPRVPLKWSSRESKPPCTPCFRERARRMKYFCACVRTCAASRELIGLSARIPSWPCQLWVRGHKHVHGRIRPNKTEQEMRKRVTQVLSCSTPGARERRESASVGPV